MRIDLDELERELRASMENDYAIGDGWAPSDRQVLALIARIRELEGALFEAADDIDNERDAQRAQRFVELLERGAVLP